MFLNDLTVPGVTAGSVSNNFGFIILCLQDVPSEVSVSLSRIKNLFDDSRVRLALPARLARDDDGRFAKLGVPIDVGSKTVTGIINSSVSNSECDWNLVIMSGGCVTKNLIKKYLYFCRDDKDFIYPVVNRRWVFSDASINGILFNRRHIPLAPEDESDINMTRAEWGERIVGSGGKLKGIIGANF